MDTKNAHTSDYMNMYNELLTSEKLITSRYIDIYMKSFLLQNYIGSYDFMKRLLIFSEMKSAYTIKSIFYILKEIAKAYDYPISLMTHQHTIISIANIGIPYTIAGQKLKEMILITKENK